MAGSIFYAGSVKWLEQPYGVEELAQLQRAAPYVPGFDSATTALISVSRAGFSDQAAAGLTLRWTPEDVVRAFT